jgi:hypothetical protein
MTFSLLDCREIISGRPVLGGRLFAIIDAAFLEGFELRLAVAEKFDADTVEMVQAFLHRQVFRPIVCDALIFDELPGGEIADLVSAGAQNRLHGRGFKIAILEPAFRQDGHLHGIEKGIGSAPLAETYAHFAITGCLHLFHACQILAQGRMSLLFDGRIGERHVLRRDRRAVVKTRFLASLNVQLSRSLESVALSAMRP